MSDADDNRLAHAFLKGVARVPIEALKFDHDLFVHQHRPVSEKIVERLRTVFRREGCLRYDSGNWIDALVDSDHLASVLTKNGLRETDLHPDAQKFPLLEFNRVDCLQGIHRVLAATSLLNPNDRWWTVKLYFRDLPRDACIKIIEGTLNEQPHSDGEIFRKIRLYSKMNDRSSEQKWWARLTTTKQKDLRQLLKNPALTSAFDSLIDMPGLWYPVKLGTLHRLLTLHCDEELRHYLSRVSHVWKTILEASGVSPEVVDRDTVEKLELLAPSASSSDRELIESLVRSRSVFRDVTDQMAREALLSSIVSQSGLIPSLRSFFENLKYLEPCCNILKKIIPAKERRTIYQSLSGAYFAPSEQAVEYSEHRRKKRPKRDYSKDIWLSYVQLWAFCMRHFPAMTQLLPRKELGKEKPLGYSNTSLWHHLGYLATSLGFKTEEALHYRAQNPHKALAEQLLRSACPESIPDAGFVTRVASILKETEPTSEASQGPKLTRESYLPIERRCGRPFEDDFVEDKDSLFIPFIYESEPSTGRDISPFFVKRDMFLSFFGNEYERANEGTEIDDDNDDDGDTGNDDDDGHHSSAESVSTSRDFGPDQASAARIQELDEALRKEKQQTDQLQKKSTQLALEMDRLRNQLSEQTNKTSELERRGEDLQAKCAVLERSSATDNAQSREDMADLKEKMADLKKESHKVTQELENTRKELDNTRKELDDTRKKLEDTQTELEDTQKALADAQKKLREKGEQLDKMTKEKEKFEELHDCLSAELDRDKLHRVHPPEGSMDRDLLDAKMEVSELRRKLSDANKDAKAKRKELENALSEVEKAADLANEKSNGLERALGKEKADAQKYRQAQEGAKEKMKELQNALHKVEREAEERKTALDSAEKKAEGCQKAFVEAEEKAKTVLDDAERKTKAHEEEMSRLRQHVFDVEELYRKRDDEAQQKDNASGEAVEQLKKSLEEREKQTKSLEHEIQGLREQMGNETIRPKDQTLQNKVLLDLFLMSLEPTRPGTRHPIWNIQIVTGKGMLFIHIPDGDCEARIGQILDTIKQVEGLFELGVLGKSVLPRDWNVPTVKEMLRKYAYCTFNLSVNLNFGPIKKNFDSEPRYTDRLRSSTRRGKKSEATSLDLRNGIPIGPEVYAYAKRSNGKRQIIGKSRLSQQEHDITESTGLKQATSSSSNQQQQQQQQQQQDDDVSMQDVDMGNTDNQKATVSARKRKN